MPVLFSGYVRSAQWSYNPRQVIVVFSVATATPFAHRFNKRAKKINSAIELGYSIEAGRNPSWMRNCLIFC